MFDHTTIELLSDGDCGDVPHDYLAGQIDQTNIFGANSVAHYDAEHHDTGRDSELGNSVLHQDAESHYSGSSKMEGDELVTRDSSGAIVSRDSFLGGAIIHRNAQGSITGRTDAFGNDFDAGGRLLGRRGK